MRGGELRVSVGVAEEVEPGLAAMSVGRLLRGKVCSSGAMGMGARRVHAECLRLRSAARAVTVVWGWD